MKRIISVFALSFLMTLFVVAQEVTINFEYPQVKQNGKYIELVYSNCFDVAAPGYPVIPFYQYNILEKQNNVSGKVLVKSVEYYDEEIEGRLLPAGKPIPIHILQMLWTELKILRYTAPSQHILPKTCLVQTLSF